MDLTYGQCCASRRNERVERAPVNTTAWRRPRVTLSPRAALPAPAPRPRDLRQRGRERHADEEALHDCRRRKAPAVASRTGNGGRSWQTVFFSDDTYRSETPCGPTRTATCSCLAPAVSDTPLDAHVQLLAVTTGEIAAGLTDVDGTPGLEAHDLENHGCGP